MKRLLSLLVIGLGLTACQDTTVTQPSEAAADIALQASVQPATTTPIAALITFTEIVEPSDVRVTGKVVHETGSVYLWIVSGELTGLFVAYHPIFLYHQEDLANGVGSWYMDLTAPCAGTIEGRYHSKIDPGFHGMMVGQGQGGCSGVTLKGYFTPLYPGNNFVQSFEGTWHEPGGKIH